MSFFGLSPAMFAFGALSLLASVLLLHLLRVRLRRVEVDTLLFFQLAGALRQPRVLPGKPARWLSLLLAALVALAAWTAFADPHASATAASRIVVVEGAGGELRQARLDAARQVIERDGLGPRGAVLAAAASPAVLVAAGEPAAALDLRSAALPACGSKADGSRALRAAADLLRPGDELVWIGGRLPAIAGDLPVRELLRGADPALQLRGLRWLRLQDGAFLQLDVTAAAGGSAALLGSGGEIASAAFAAAPQTLQLGPVPAGAGELRLQLQAGGGSYAATLATPAAQPLRVHVAADLPAELQQALTVLLQVDAETEPVATADAADVLVLAADRGDRRPCLLLDRGTGSGARQALLAAASPVALSLRDRASRDAPALAAVDGATVWVEDAAQGAPLVQAERDGERRRIRIVDWLLEPITHADVPLLLGAALRQLGNRHAPVIAVAGQPLLLPATFAAPAVVDPAVARSAPAIDAPAGPDARTATDARAATDASAGAPAGITALPADGCYRLQWSAAGAQRLRTADGDVDVLVLPAPAAVAAGAVAPAADPDLEARGGDGSLLPWFAGLLLLLVAVDAFLFHRGRLP